MIILNIMGGTVLIIGSFLVSCVLMFKGAANIFTKVLDHGYKLSDNVDYEIGIDEIKDVALDKLARKRTFLSKFLVFIPGINIAYAAYSNYVLSNAIEESLGELLDDGIIVPMTNEELIKYSEANGDVDKFMYFILTSAEKEVNLEYKDDINDIVSDKPKVLFFNSLEEKYSLNSIKNLSFKSVAFGTIDGKAIAIVSDEEEPSDFSKVRFCNDDEIYDFEAIDDLEDENLMFDVYPLDFKTNARVTSNNFEEESFDYDDYSKQDMIDVLEKVISENQEYFSEEELSRLNEDLSALKDEKISSENERGRSYVKRER